MLVVQFLNKKNIVEYQEFIYELIILIIIVMLKNRLIYIKELVNIFHIVVSIKINKKWLFAEP